MQQPLLCRTWAPRAHTPILYEQVARDKLSVISALVVSPKRHHLSLYFAIYSKNIGADVIIEFLRQLRRHGVRRFILVQDRLPAHRAKKLQRFIEQSPRSILEVEWLPTYAPKLNPVEPRQRRGNNTKYHKLANFTPETMDCLYEKVDSSLLAVRDDQHLLRSFFAMAKLKL